MKTLIKIGGLLLVLLTTSCATTKVPFTSSIQKQFSEKSLKKVQFYTSERIVLYKVSGENQNASTNGGVILLSTKNSSEKIIIEKGTPCSFEKSIGDNISLFRFEDEDGKVIPFGNTNGGNFNLLAKNWKNNTGTITYANEDYSTSNGSAYLMVEVKKLSKVESKERTLKGKKVK